MGYHSNLGLGTVAYERGWKGDSESAQASHSCKVECRHFGLKFPRHGFEVVSDTLTKVTIKCVRCNGESSLNQFNHTDEIERGIASHALRHYREDNDRRGA
jgi:hypothetical protein